MLKQLFVLILFIGCFEAVNAQNPVDSVKRAPVDTISKHSPADSINNVSINNTKQSIIDSVKHLPVDSAAKHQPADTVVKHAAVDSVAKHPAGDTVVQNPPIIKPSVDSVFNHLPAKTTVKHPAVSNSVKHGATESALKSPPAVVPIKHSPIKTLSDKKYNALLNGDDLDSMAMAGEMNHYPLPETALKYKVQIGLNPGQITKLKAMAAELHRKKVEMGNNIIRNEKMLDSLFHSKQIIDGTLIFYTNRSGLYLGELRGAILMTCYQAEKILSDDQIRKLEALEKVN